MAGTPAFGERIRTLREQKKAENPAFSLRQFAERVGISATFLSKVERGEFDPPAPDKIKRMAEELGLDADELLALAGRVDPDLNDIIKQQPKEIADFLRTAQGVSAERLRQLTDQLRRDKQ